jgi:hypothetical protein
VHIDSEDGKDAEIVIAKEGETKLCGQEMVQGDLFKISKAASRAHIDDQ